MKMRTSASVFGSYQLCLLVFEYLHLSEADCEDENSSVCVFLIVYCNLFTWICVCVFAFMCL